MTYARDDDRWYREQLQALGDNLGDTYTLLADVKAALREDDELGTYEARQLIHAAQMRISDARVKIGAAFRRLPTPEGDSVTDATPSLFQFLPRRTESARQSHSDPPLDAAMSRLMWRHVTARQSPDVARQEGARRLMSPPTEGGVMTYEELVRWWGAHSAESHKSDEYESNGGGREGWGDSDDDE